MIRFVAEIRPYICGTHNARWVAGERHCLCPQQQNFFLYSGAQNMSDEATIDANPSSSSTSDDPSTKDSHPSSESGAGRQLRTLPIERIDPSPYQIREVFDDNSLRELAGSMKQAGLWVPILVRPIAERFQIVGGERRLRAAKLLGWTSIPALVQELSDLDAAVGTVVENEHRIDANPLERARGYQTLKKTFNLQQEDVAARIGVSPAVVSRLLSLLVEPPEIQKLVASGSISLTHLRTLDDIEDQSARVEAAKQAAEKQWSVRETKRARKATKGASGKRESKETSESQPGESVWGVVGHVFQVLRWIGLFRWLFKWLRTLAVRLIPGREDARVGNLPPRDPVEPPDPVEPRDSKPSDPKAV